MEWGTPQSQMTFYTMTLCHAEGLLLRRMSSMAKGCWDKWKQKELQGHRDCKPNYNNGSLPSTYAQMRKRLLSVQEEDSQVADSSINFRLLTLCLYQISHLNIKYFFLLHNSQQSLTHTQPPSCGRKTLVCVCARTCARTPRSSFPSYYIVNRNTLMHAQTYFGQIFSTTCNLAPTILHWVVSAIRTVTNTECTASCTFLRTLNAS